MSKILRKLRITKVDLCRAGANPDADILLFKSRDLDDTPAPTPTPKEDSAVKKTMATKPTDLATATPDEIAKYVSDLETTITAQEAELEKAKKPEPTKKVEEDCDGDAEEDMMMKSLPEPIRKMVEQTLQKAADAQKTADEAKEQLRKAQDVAELAVIQKKVEAEFSHVPGTTEELAKMLQEAEHTLTSQSFTVLTKALKAGSEAIAKATREVGSGKSATTTSAIDEIHKRADELVTSRVCKTRPEAIAKVAGEDPELYTRYKAEQRQSK